MSNFACLVEGEVIDDRRRFTTHIFGSGFAGHDGYRLIAADDDFLLQPQFDATCGDQIPKRFECGNPAIGADTHGILVHDVIRKKRQPCRSVLFGFGPAISSDRLNDPVRLWHLRTPFLSAHIPGVSRRLIR
jgi:hypothetical protein